MFTKTDEPEQPVIQIKTIKNKFPRLNSIDLLRGLVMIIMALDHTRDFFSNATTNPLDLSTTTPLFFFTRWITHFCAPVFVFLSGASIYLQAMRKTKSELSVFLIKRGLWLLFVELVLMSFCFSFDIHYHLFILQVIWAIGISMIFLGLLIYLPYSVLFALGAIIVLCHNSLDFYEARHVGNYGLLYDLFHRGNFAIHTLWANHVLVILYPFLPWTGLMLLGYCFGKLYRPEVNSEFRRKLLLRLGMGLLVFFAILRWSNIYGDPFTWSLQKNGLYSFLSFINVNKYPPSLLYLCLMIGPSLIFLSVFENAKSLLSKAIIVYGRVPFFYYLIHFYTIHVLCMALFLIRGHTFEQGEKTVPFKFLLPGDGYSLWMVYVIWICIVAFLYPLCKWYSEYKATHKKWWMSYI